MKRYSYNFELDAEEAQLLGEVFQEWIYKCLEAQIGEEFNEAEKAWFLRHKDWTQSVLDKIHAGITVKEVIEEIDDGEKT